MAKAMKAKRSIAVAKAMKAAKDMKGIAKAMKKTMSKVAKGKVAKVLVLRGSKAKTVCGLTANDLIKNKNGKVVSKKRSALAKKNPWIKCFMHARKLMGITRFVALHQCTALQMLYLEPVETVEQKLYRNTRMGYDMPR